MCRTTKRRLLMPSARAASTNSFSRSDRNCARTSRATGIHRKPPITATIRMKTPSSGPTSPFKRVAKQVNDQQQQRQWRQRQEQVGQPHQRRIDAAVRHAGDRAYGGADDDRHHHGSQPDRERYAAAIQHPGKQILAEIVSAERMSPGRPFEMRAEIDVVDRHVPQERSECHCEQHQTQDDGARDGQPMPQKPSPCLDAGRGPLAAATRSGSSASGRRCEGRASHRGCRQSD